MPRQFGLLLRIQSLAAGIICMLLCAPLKASTWLDLQLDAPLQCPDRASIEASLERLIQHASPAPLRVSARFVTDGSRWVLFAAFENGQRVIPGDSCLAVAEALVVMLALAVDPTVSLQSADFPELRGGNAPGTSNTPGASNAPEASNAPGTTNAQAPQSQPANTAQPSDRPLPPVFVAVSPVEQRLNLTAKDPHASVPQRQKQEHRFGISFLMLAQSFQLPTWSLGSALFVRYGSRKVWGEVAASGLYPRYVPTQQDENKGGHIGWVAGQLAGCASPARALPLAGCLGVELGDVFGKASSTLANRQTGHALWAAVTASAVFRAEFRKQLGVELRLGAALPFEHTGFGLEGYGEVFRPDWVSLRAMAGFFWR